MNLRKEVCHRRKMLVKDESSSRNIPAISFKMTHLQDTQLRETSKKYEEEDHTRLKPKA